MNRKPIARMLCALAAGAALSASGGCASPWGPPVGRHPIKWSPAGASPKLGEPAFYGHFGTCWSKWPLGWTPCLGPKEYVIEPGSPPPEVIWGTSPAEEIAPSPSATPDAIQASPSPSDLRLIAPPDSRPLTPPSAEAPLPNPAVTPPNPEVVPPELDVTPRAGDEPTLAPDHGAAPEPPAPPARDDAPQGDDAPPAPLEVEPSEDAASTVYLIPPPGANISAVAVPTAHHASPRAFKASNGAASNDAASNDAASSGGAASDDAEPIVRYVEPRP